MQQPEHPVVDRDTPLSNLLVIVFNKMYAGPGHAEFQHHTFDFHVDHLSQLLFALEIVQV